MALKIQGTRLDPTTDSPDSKPLPRRGAPARGAFKMGHLPFRWDWDDELGRFLPQLSTLTFMPGVQGTRAMRKGADGRERLDTSAAVAHFKAKGGVVIEPDDHRLTDFRAYQQRVQNDAGADVNFSIFESFDVIGGEVWWDHNTDEFRRFRLLLLESGMVAPIHSRVKKRLVELQNATINDLRKRFGRNPAHDGLRTELEVAEARALAMTEGISTADAIAQMRGAKVAPVDVDSDLEDARAHLAKLQTDHPSLYSQIVGRKRVASSSLERVQGWIETIEDSASAAVE